MSFDHRLHPNERLDVRVESVRHQLKFSVGRNERYCSVVVKARQTDALVELDVFQFDWLAFAATSALKQHLKNIASTLQTIVNWTINKRQPLTDGPCSQTTPEKTFASTLRTIVSSLCERSANFLIQCKKVAKSFPSYLTHGVALISKSVALSQAPAEAMTTANVSDVFTVLGILNEKCIKNIWMNEYANS